MTKKETAVYRIFDPETTTSYIGATTYSCSSRFNKHLTMLRSNKHHCKPLQSGWNNRKKDFIFEVLEVFPTSIDVWIEEQRWWDHFNTTEAVFNRRPNREHRPAWSSEEKSAMIAKVSDTYTKKIASGELLTPWERKVRLYGEDGAKERNRLAALGNKNATALKNINKTETHKQAISESIKKLSSIIIECEICGQQCKGRSALGRHKQSKHKRTCGGMADTLA